MEQPASLVEVGGREEEGTFSYFWSNGEGRGGGGENFCLLFAKVTEGVRTGFANFQNPDSAHFLKIVGFLVFVCYFLRFSLWQIPHRETERWRLPREEGGGGGRVFCKVRERRLPPDNIEWIGGEGRRKWESKKKKKKKKKEKLLPVAAHPRVGGGNKSPPLSTPLLAAEERKFL